MNKILAICTSPDRGGLELYFTKFVEYYYRKKSLTSLHTVVRKNSYISQVLKRFGNSNKQKEISKISIINLIFHAIHLAKYVNNQKIDIYSKTRINGLKRIFEKLSFRYRFKIL